MTEEWRAITGYPDYEVSSWGRVRSWKKQGGGGLSESPHILKPWKQKRGGYPAVAIALGGNRKITKNVHTLVLETFVGPKPEGLECCHRDGNPQNNHLSNLYWGTRSNNVQDMLKHGTWARERPTNRGSLHHSAKLTEEDVKNIRRCFIPGINDKNRGNGKALAEEFGITYATLNGIVKRKTWRHV